MHSKTDTVVIYTDGGARGNPGPAAAGAVLFDAQGNVLREISDYLGETTNNVAEYEALVRSLMAAVELFGNKLKDMHVDVRMDSELIVRQMTGLYKVKNEKLKILFSIAANLRMTQIPNMTFTHVPREKNKHADALVNKAIDAHI